MASIDKRNGRWRARWRTPEGQSRCLTFDRKLDAERHLTSVQHSMLTGAYVDPAAGKVTFKSYAEDWRARQVWRPSTAARVATTMTLHVYPVLGDRPIAAVRQSELQGLVRRLSEGMKPGTVAYTYRQVAAVFRAAVLDRVVPSSPCVRVALPKVDRPKVQPLEVATVDAIAGSVPARYGALMVVAAGAGLRMSEAVGLTVDRVDFLRRTVTVDRQLVTPVGGPPVFAPPKTAASSRVVPVGQVVVDALAAHLAAFGEGADRLVFTSDAGEGIRRQNLAVIFKTAATAAGAPWATFHDLRHHFASVLIGAGCSVKAVQEALGHANASETLDTYSHLWPADEDRLRAAIDGAWKSSRVPAVSRRDAVEA